MRPWDFGDPSASARTRKGDVPCCAGAPAFLCDDHGNQARVLTVGVRLDGLDAESADTAELALERLEREPFDLVVVDLMLPRTNGIQLARLIRQRHPRTRVVLTSTYHLSERQLTNADCGAVGFVPRPLAASDLVRFLVGAPADASPRAGALA